MRQNYRFAFIAILAGALVGPLPAWSGPHGPAFQGGGGSRMGNHQGATLLFHQNSRPDRIDRRHDNEIRREDRRRNRPDAPRFEQAPSGNAAMGAMGMGRMGLDRMQ